MIDIVNEAEILGLGVIMLTLIVLALLVPIVLLVERIERRRQARQRGASQSRNAPDMRDWLQSERDYPGG